jgi:hypothetical protein
MAKLTWGQDFEAASSLTVSAEFDNGLPQEGTDHDVREHRGPSDHDDEQDEKVELHWFFGV